MATGRKRGSIEEGLEALRAALVDPSSTASKELFRTALLHAPAYVAARAADAVRDHLVGGLVLPLTPDDAVAPDLAHAA
jgi:hypothetical protein